MTKPEIRDPTGLPAFCRLFCRRCLRSHGRLLPPDPSLDPPDHSLLDTRIAVVRERLTRIPFLRSALDLDEVRAVPLGRPLRSRKARRAACVVAVVHDELPVLELSGVEADDRRRGSTCESRP